GIRFRKIRLTAPARALKAKRTENCHAAGSFPSSSDAKIMVTKLPQFTQAASIVRNFPRTEAGTREDIHGSQAQLDMPRERLKPNRNRRINDNRAVASTNDDSSGTSAMQ